MKIVIATPLYPPDIAEPAPYVKELARRLAKNHQVTVIIYGHLPEKVPGVSFICVNKRRPLPIRLLCFSFALWKTTLSADIIYAENGASVELPAGIIAILTHRPLIMHIGDKQVHQRAAKKSLLGCIEHFAFSHAKATITDNPLKRPEILPFEPVPEDEIVSYQTSWKTHIHMLQNIFKNYV